MRQQHYTVTPAQVHRHTHDHLQHYLPLRDHGPKCTAATVYNVLLWAASHLTSIAAACATLAKAPSDQAIRDALHATLPDFNGLLRQRNRALAGGLPRALTKRRQRIALDLVLLPYYGQHEQDPNEIYRGARKAGTKRFHAYATAYVIYKGCRTTLALLSVGHSDPWEDIVAGLLRQVRKAGVRIACVLLDRGFYCVDVIRYLQRARYPFIMPAIRRGYRPSHPKGPSGTWVFTMWRRSGWANYTLQDKARQRATVRLCVACVRPRQRDGRLGKRRVWLYATWGIGKRSVAWVRETYRRRFGIESSYRQLNQGRVRTSSRSPLLRLLYVGLALVLRNVYVWLHWEVLARLRRGYRVVDLSQLPLKSMLLWLQDVVEGLLGPIASRPSQRPMLA
jgi:putative transposase